jgi:hypothetical protein
MDAQTVTKQLVQLEQEHQNAIATALRIEGAIAILRQMLAQLEKSEPTTEETPQEA